jgi:hypothetical protein
VHAVFLEGNLKERDRLKDLVEDVKKTLKWVVGH